MTDMRIGTKYHRENLSWSATVTRMLDDIDDEFEADEQRAILENMARIVDNLEQCSYVVLDGDSWEGGLNAVGALMDQDFHEEKTKTADSTSEAG